MTGFNRYIIFIASSGLFLLLLESIIKYFLVLYKLPFEGVYFFNNNFHLGFYSNSNILFGIPLANFYTVIIVSAILIMLVFFFWWSFKRKDLYQLLTLSLVLAGALSNLIDRLMFGFVIDYINISFWPVFNLADVMIVIGVGIYLITEFNE